MHSYDFFHLLCYPRSLKGQMILTDAMLARRALLCMPDRFMTPLSSLPLFIGLLFLAHISVPHEVSVQEMQGDVISQRPVCSCYISLRKENTG